MTLPKKLIEYELLIGEWRGRIPGEWYLEYSLQKMDKDERPTGEYYDWADATDVGVLELVRGDRLRIGENARSAVEGCWLAGMVVEGYAKEVEKAAKTEAPPLADARGSDKGEAA